MNIEQNFCNYSISKDLKAYYHYIESGEIIRQYQVLTDKDLKVLILENLNKKT